MKGSAPIRSTARDEALSRVVTARGAAPPPKPMMQTRPRQPRTPCRREFSLAMGCPAFWHSPQHHRKRSVPTRFAGRSDVSQLVTFLQVAARPVLALGIVF